MDSWSAAADEKINQILERFTAMEKELRELKLSVYKSVNELSNHRPSYNKPWTSHDHKSMVRDYRLGIPVEDLARRYGRGRGAIRARLEGCREWRLR